MLINRCAQALLGHCGMKPREVVGLLLPNIPEYIIVCHGAIEAGLTVTFVNPLYTPGKYTLFLYTTQQFRDRYLATIFTRRNVYYDTLF